MEARTDVTVTITAPICEWAKILDTIDNAEVWNDETHEFVKLIQGEIN